MAAGTKAPVHGIQKGHAYTVEHAFTVGGTKLIKLRNPWGKTNYNGPWHNKDRRWTSAYRRIAGEASSGIFFVPLNVFKAAFHSYIINYYRNWHSTKHSVR